jgi:hypothetical protein
MKILRWILVGICAVVFVSGIYISKKTTLRYSLVISEKDASSTQNISMESIPSKFRYKYDPYPDFEIEYYKKRDYLSYLSNIIAISYTAAISSGIGLAMLLYSIYRKKPLHQGQSSA